MGVIGTVFFYKTQFNNHVKEAIFSECFDYYANLDKENGISQDSITVCVEKANRWTKEISPNKLK